MLLPSARDISEHQLTVSHLEFVWSHLINLTFTLYEPCQRHYAGQITNFTPIPNQGNCSVVPIRISIKGCIGYSAPSVPYQCLQKIEENLIITMRTEYILFTLLYLRFALWGGSILDYFAALMHYKRPHLKPLIDLAKFLIISSL